MNRATMIAVALVAMAGLSGCGDNASAVETRDRGAATPTALSGPLADEAGRAEDAAPAQIKAPVTANRRETVDEKIRRLYARNGVDFGARSPEEFLAKITAFTAAPPADVERASRPNGDTLLYQASTNTFAVVARDGTPRTMFKPDEGAAYWAEQKAAAPTFGQRRDAG